MADQLIRLSTALGERYAIERELGTGGMATVYLATDRRHDRRVALKVLRPELAAMIGAERFLTEIRTTANLQHPHILPLFDSGRANEVIYYVMPFVDGESLRSRLDRERQLSIPEAIRIATEVASGLDYAHRHGVVHRDIKPENILLHEGSATLADFGIALALNQATGHRMTETGLSLGTPQYMSPEQATGDRQLDGRTDVYSLGAVTYEMLAGEPPHTGPNAQAIIAKLMTERPTRLRVVRDTVPDAVDDAVMTALSKAPADRFRTAGEFAAALRAEPEAVARKTSGTRLFLWTTIAVAVVAASAVAGYRLFRPAPLPSVGRSEQLTADAGLEIQPDLSPDGRLVAYAAGNAARMRIFIRPAGGGAGGGGGGGRTIPLSDDFNAVETMPQWSPDGTQLLFLTGRGAAVAPALGGSSRPVVPPAGGAVVTAAFWSPDGREVGFVRGDSLMVGALGGGQPRLVAVGSDLHSCRWSPSGRWIACVSHNGIATRPGPTFGNLAPSAILLIPSRGGQPVAVAEAVAFNQSPIFSADGRRLFFVSNRDGPRDVYAVEISSSGRTRRPPERLTTGLGAGSISLSADGRRLGYAVYGARANIWALPIRAGRPAGVEAAEPLTTGSQVIEAIRVSPDGRWLLYDSDLRGNADIYRIPIGGGPAEQLTTDPADEFAPDLSPDGRELVYHVWRGGHRNIEIKPLDGGPVEPAASSPSQESYPKWSPDGRAIAYFDQASVSIHVTRRTSQGGWLPAVLLVSRSQRPDWSPDGRWIAFTQGARVPEPGPVTLIPAGGGASRALFQPSASAPPAENPQWAPDNRTIYYKSHDSTGLTTFWALPASGGAPRLVARLADPARQSNRMDFATDGKRLYFAIEDRQSDVYVANLIAR